MKKHLLLLTSLFVTATLCHAQTTPILWGMTPGGGANHSGTLFSYNTSTGTETVLYSFGGISTGYDLGSNPYGSLMKASNGLLYGMTSTWGFNDSGTIFSYNISTNTESEQALGGGTNGTTPYGSLIQASDSLLYGMTSEGGSVNWGTIFSYNTSTSVRINLHDFVGESGDGNGPYGSLIQAGDSLLYGLTVDGASDNGVMISYNIYTGKESDLHDFGSGNDGYNPYGALLLAKNGLLYGMTSGGGYYGGGIIFSYNISNGTYTDVHDFAGYLSDDDAAFPFGSLIQVGDSLLYGMTSQGGSNLSGSSSSLGYGAIFSYNISTGNDAVLHSFNNNDTDGIYPRGSLFQASNGLLYGMTYGGGADGGYGTIFSYNISSGVETVLHSFSGGNDGVDPFGDLIEVDSTSTTGINQLAVKNNQLLIYPNPSTGQFTINLYNNQTGYTVEVYNVLGEKIYQAILSNSQNVIDLSTHPTGMYFIYLKSGEGVETGEVIITK